MNIRMKTTKNNISHSKYQRGLNSECLPAGGVGLAISNNTVPVSKSRILNLVKSTSYTFASGEHRYPGTH